MQLLLATRNAHKTREFRELLGKDFEVEDLSPFPEIKIPEEIGRTFKENAILKATAVARDRHGLVVADDSGLEVGALGSAPGIYSARYAGKDATDKENTGKLLGELARLDAKGLRRSARFRCVIALAIDGKLLRTFHGAVDGTIAVLPRGSRGFGYDPIFVPNGFDKTFGEMPAQLKNQISHRARAICALRAGLANLEPGA